MKKAIQINLGGQVFHIDEDAYEKLKNYLARINQRFSSDIEGKEIVEDIESRMAELFADKITSVKQSIGSADVNEIIEIMGEPEEMFDDGVETEEKEEDKKSEKRSQKRLYRDPDSATIGGVCSGLAVYFGIEIAWMRLLFLVLFFINGLGLIIYLILWIAVPAAHTTAQKLEMQGEDITVSNIERNFKREYQNARRNFKNFQQTKNYREVRGFFSDFFRALGEIIGFLMKAIVVLIGFIFLLAGGSILLGIFSSLFFGFSLIPFLGLGHFDFPFFFDSLHWPDLYTISLYLTIGIPILVILYGGLKMIFQFRVRDRKLGMGIFVIWIISAIVFLTQWESHGRGAEAESMLEQSYPVNDFAGSRLYLNMDTNKTDRLDDYHKYTRNHITYYFDNNNDRYYGKPQIQIKVTQASNPEITLVKKARGEHRSKAGDHANHIIYHWEQKDSLLLFDPYFRLPRKQDWNESAMTLHLSVTKGDTLFFAPSLKQYLNTLYYENKRWSPDELAGQTWIIKETKLQKMTP